MQQLYKCDPTLNTKCSKQNCKHNVLSANPICELTNNIMFAKKPVTKVTMVIPMNKTDKVLFDIKEETKSV